MNFMKERKSPYRRVVDNFHNTETGRIALLSLNPTWKRNPLFAFRFAVKNALPTLGATFGQGMKVGYGSLLNFLPDYSGLRNL
jgi:hypothetical protein